MIKVEIFLEQREVAFLSPSKICEDLNFSTVHLQKFKFSQILLGDEKAIYLCSKIISTLPVIPYIQRNNWQQKCNSTILYEFAQRPKISIQILICLINMFQRCGPYKVRKLFNLILPGLFDLKNILNCVEIPKIVDTRRNSRNMNRAIQVSNFLICGAHNVVEHYKTRSKVLQS